MPDRWAKLAQVYGAYVAAYMVLAVALVVLLRRQDDAAAGTAALPSPGPARDAA